MSVGPLIALRNPLILFFRAQNDNLKNKNLFGNEGKELEGWANQTIWCVEEKTKNGSPGRDRTCDMVINSHPLCRLSYRGSWEEMTM